MIPVIKKDAIRRMKIIQGQVNTVLKMIEEEKYCPDVLTQCLAVENGMKQVEAKLLEGHLQTCVAREMKEGKIKKTTEELLQIFKLSKKNK